MKTRVLIIIGIVVAVAGILISTTITFDDFAIYLCDSWFFNTCVKIWEDPDCHRPGSGCIISEKTDSEQLRRIFDYCNTKETGIAMIQPRWTYSNDTHYINNDTCEWKIIEKGNIDIALFEKNRNQLSQVSDWCNDTSSVKYGFYNYSNETHSINTSTCEWKEHVTYPANDSLCVPYVEKGVAVEDWSNKTHYFDTTSCTWKDDPNYDALNSKGCPQFCPKEESPSQGGPAIPFYDSELMLSFDSSRYHPVFDVGSPLIYKETSEPVLDATNCERYAYWMTEHQKEKIDLYYDYPRYPPWGNQIFPLVEYCLENGDLVKSSMGDEIQWSFYRTVDGIENEK